MPPAPTYPAPAPFKATQPPLASNLPGFWQILLRQVLRTAAGWSQLKGPLETPQPTQAQGPSRQMREVAPLHCPPEAEQGCSLPLGVEAQELLRPYLDVFRAPGM